MRFNATLQENIITLLAYNEEAGRVVHRLVKAELFDGDYRLIAERCITFWQRHKAPPRQHTSDLFSDILEDRDNKKAKQIRSILKAMFELSSDMNTQYIVYQVRTFTRMQRLRSAIQTSAEKISANKEIAIGEVEQIWNDLLRTRELDFDPGLRLSDFKKVLEFSRARDTEFLTGIRELDSRYITPARATLGVFLAVTGYGKSWWLIHLMKQAFLQRKKVAYISLELGQEQVAQRAYQSFFAVPKRAAKIEVTQLIKDDFGRVSGFESAEVKPDFSLDSLVVEEELRSRLRWMDERMDNIVIKRFPTGGLTVDQLDAYLDNLEAVDKFIPDIVLVDYLGAMKTDPRDRRVSLGLVCSQLRGVAVNRNIAVYTAHQTSKQAVNALEVNATHVAEDWSIIGTADQVLTYSRTREEHKHGLARLFVAKGRDEKDGFSVLITQNYDTGQFALDSSLLTYDYRKQLEEYVEKIDGSEQEEDEDE